MSFLSFVILYFLIGLIAFGILYIYDDKIFNIRNENASEQVFIYMTWLLFFSLYLIIWCMNWYIDLLETICIRKNNLKK